ncbi:hypothetical protein [Lentzea sp.]|uniref:hypothetical protein n=1 Tax=Lentzea sp. TaxID=56099 RepID=UPI002ED452D8
MSYWRPITEWWWTALETTTFSLSGIDDSWGDVMFSRTDASVTPVFCRSSASGAPAAGDEAVQSVAGQAVQ